MKLSKACLLGDQLAWETRFPPARNRTQFAFSDIGPEEVLKPVTEKRRAASARCEAIGQPYSELGTAAGSFPLEMPFNLLRKKENLVFAR
jgi:hypothetical protein